MEVDHAKNYTKHTMEIYIMSVACKSGTFSAPLMVVNIIINYNFLL